MPQMAPMAWLPMMIYFNMVLILAMIMLYSTQTSKLMLSKKTIKNFLLKNKW